MSSTVTLSQPRSAHRRIAALLSAARVARFLRSRRPSSVVTSTTVVKLAKKARLPRWKVLALTLRRRLHLEDLDTAGGRDLATGGPVHRHRVSDLGLDHEPALLVHL